jgi:DNA-binding helix-hairpin-helix protein with protein kinase domain
VYDLLIFFERRGEKRGRMEEVAMVRVGFLLDQLQRSIFAPPSPSSTQLSQEPEAAGREK